MANRKRPILVQFYVSPEEQALILANMRNANIQNTGAYIRKMAIDGYVVKLDLPELRELVSLLRRSSNSLNQIAKRINSTNRFYQEDLQDIQAMQEKLWGGINRILTVLSAVS